MSRCGARRFSAERGGSGLFALSTAGVVGREAGDAEAGAHSDKGGGVQLYRTGPGFFDKVRRPCEKSLLQL